MSAIAAVIRARCLTMTCPAGLEAGFRKIPWLMSPIWWYPISNQSRIGSPGGPGMRHNLSRSRPMDFPIIDLMAQEGCRQKLFDLLHPEGFCCPRCGAREGLRVPRRHDDSPVVDYRCAGCGRVFNMFTGTQWQGTHLSPAQILSVLRGV